jgi:hypothetical protein
LRGARFAAGDGFAGCFLAFFVDMVPNSLQCGRDASSLHLRRDDLNALVHKPGNVALGYAALNEGLLKLLGPPRQVCLNHTAGFDGRRRSEPLRHLRRGHNILRAVLQDAVDGRLQLAFGSGRRLRQCGWCGFDFGRRLIPCRQLRIGLPQRLHDIWGKLWGWSRFLCGWSNCGSLGLRSRWCGLWRGCWCRRFDAFKGEA